MRQGEKLHVGKYEVRVIQVGDVAEEWAVEVDDLDAWNQLVTGQEGMRAGFDFKGFRSIDAAKAEAERFLRERDATLPTPLGEWKPLR
jgi:hypothetical protein